MGEPQQLEADFLDSYYWNADPELLVPAFLLTFKIKGKKGRKITPDYLENLQRWLTKVFKTVKELQDTQDICQVSIFDSYLVHTNLRLHNTILPLTLMMLDNEFCNTKTSSSDDADVTEELLKHKEEELKNVMEELAGTEAMHQEKKADLEAVISRVSKDLEETETWDYGRKAQEQYLELQLAKLENINTDFQNRKARLSETAMLLKEEIQLAGDDTQFLMDIDDLTKPRPGELPGMVEVYNAMFSMSDCEFEDEFRLWVPPDEPWTVDFWRCFHLDEWMDHRPTLDCTEKAKYLLAHHHLLAHLAKPSHPGGGVNEPINISDGTYLKYADIKKIIEENTFRPETTSAEMVFSMKDEVFKYMNRFLFHVTEGKGEFGIKKVFEGDCVKFDLKPAPSLAAELAHLSFKISYAIPPKPRKPKPAKQKKGGRVPPEKEKATSGTESDAPPPMTVVTKDFLPFKEWTASEIRNRVSRIYFRPWPNILNCHRGYFMPVDANGDKGLNSYTGYRHSMEDLASAYVGCNRSVLRGFLKLIFNNICGACPASYIYLMKYLACIVQFPFRKQQVALAMPGGQGIGKTFLMNAMAQLLGELFHKGNAESIARKFNSMYAGKTLIFMDEHTLSKSIDYNAMKTMVTDEAMNTEKKFHEQKTEENFANVVMAMNPTKLFQEDGQGLDKDDRRFFVCSCFGHLSQSLKTLTKNTIEAMTADKEKKEQLAFNFLLMNVDLTSYNSPDFPITEKGKVNRQSNCETYVLTWFHERLMQRSLLPCATTDYLSAGSETFKDGGLDKDPGMDAQDVWNPLRFQGEQLFCWRNFLKKNGKMYLSKDEWEAIRALHLKGGKLDQIEMATYQEEIIDDYWKSPVWLQVVPFDKLRKSCCSWIFTQFRHSVNMRDFNEGIKACLPKFERKMMTLKMGGVNRTVEMLVVPVYGVVMDHFNQKHSSIIVEEDRRWTEQSTWKDPPKLQLYTSPGDLKRNFQEMASKDVMLGSWVEKVDEFYKDICKSTEENGHYVEPWKPRPFLYKDQPLPERGVRQRKRQVDQIASETAQALEQLTMERLRQKEIDLVNTNRNLQRKLEEKDNAIKMLNAQVAALQQKNANNKNQ